MTSWNELRTVALVGTERRALPTATPGSALDGITTEHDTEHAALQAAALLGIGRRVAAPVSTIASPPLNAQAEAPALEAPHQAVQLLELILTGNAGPGTMSDSLLDQWYVACGNAHAVLPHRLLVMALDGATTTSRLRDPLRRVLGDRGRWLAGQRDKWSWAARPEPGESAGVDDVADRFVDIDLDELLQMPSDQRDATLVAARSANPTHGRQLIADACAKLDAASRARVLTCLQDELSLDDEDLLEAALDDRSKGVRAVAIELLNGLPGCARSTRLSRLLEPLVSKSGRLRSTINVTYPHPPEDEQLRDLPPVGTGVVEQQWFDAVIAATPLAWWENTLDMSPTKIVRSKSNLAGELLAAWSKAALAQRNQAWLEALFEQTKSPSLLPFIGDDAAAAAFLASTKSKTSLNKQMLLLQAVPGPWTLDFSSDVLEWIRSASDSKGAQGRINQAQTLLADKLHTGTQPALTTWLDSVRASENTGLQRMLRNVIQQLSLRTSIDKAFA